VAEIRISTRRTALRSGLLALAAAGAMLVAVAPALAADRVYWANVLGNPISFGNLDGSGGGNLSTTGATANEPWGSAFDPTTDRIYWANNASNTIPISYANLDGSGGGNLNTTGATADALEGVAIDPAAGRIYWANAGGSTPISYANLDGSGGGNLNTIGATADAADGVVIDPTAGRIYWTNDGSNSTPISYANLDGSGGGNLNTTGATASTPEGVAIDPTAGRIYWANNASNAIPISYANLDGSGGGNLPVTGATPDRAFGVAIDPTAGRIYWVNENSNSNPISYANLDGSGGGNLATTGASADIPGFPVLLEVPSGTAAPIVSGESTFGSQLACSEGNWAPDFLASFLYRAPQSFSYSWSLNGSPISGATSSSITVSAGGQYACQVTAANFAGSMTQSSPAFTVPGSPIPPPAAATTTTKTSTIGDQRITLTTPVACIAPPGKLAATATSTKQATGTKLRLSSLALYVGRGIKHIRREKHGKKAITVVTYSPNAIVHHVPATVELSVARLTAGADMLTVTFSYQKTVRQRGHKKLLTVTKTLKVPFSVC
jgi:DNA-binding beta-propeller fold protein YncE